MPYKPHITAWSYSRWSVYNKCAFKAKCKFVDKIPEPSSPQMDRGNDVHVGFEDYLKDKKKNVSNEFSFMKPVIDEFRKKKAVAEEQIAFDRLWNPTDWFAKNAWLRVKTDVAFWFKANYRITVDYKTGKEYDTHREQSDLYALTEFERFEPQFVDVQFIYVDLPKKVTYEYSDTEYPLLKEIWNERGEIMTRDKVFKPQPGGHCRWCHYSKARNGPCKY